MTILSGISLVDVKLDGNIATGPAHVLAAICKCLGFKNDCRKGRVFLTEAKRRLLADAIAAARAERMAVAS